jgi:hypothetical protein
MSSTASELALIATTAPVLGGAVQWVPSDPVAAAYMVPVCVDVRNPGTRPGGRLMVVGVPIDAKTLAGVKVVTVPSVFETNTRLL